MMKKIFTIFSKKKQFENSKKKINEKMLNKNCEFNF